MSDTQVSDRVVRAALDAITAKVEAWARAHRERTEVSRGATEQADLAALRDAEHECQRRFLEMFETMREILEASPAPRDCSDSPRAVSPTNVDSLRDWSLEMVKAADCAAEHGFARIESGNRRLSAVLADAADEIEKLRAVIKGLRPKHQC
jgi:hypothetical protein